MPTEIERKFLVDLNKWEVFNKPLGKLYKQGYLINEPNRTVRVRVAGNSAYITLKGTSTGISRSEYEYAIPLNEGYEILRDFTLSAIEKTRYNVEYAGHTWEVDVFMGRNSGLIIAEIELQHEDEIFEKPEWVGNEVSYDGRYTNASLSILPFNDWK
jgi:adenylate cyclase